MFLNTAPEGAMSHTETRMDFDNNITYRKPHRTRSLTELSKSTTNNEKTILDTTMMSIPDSFHNTIDDVRELTEENNILKKQLQSAHQEIENLNVENFRLKSDLQNMIKTVNTCKKICSTPEKKSVTPTRKNKSLHQLSTPKYITTESKLQPHLERTTNKQNKETQTTAVHTQTPDQTKIIPTTIATKKSKFILKPKQRNRLCILSCSKIKGTTPLVEEYFSEYFNYCHYIMPNCTIMRLMNNIEPKIKNFTLDDYCLLFLGENEIADERNYLEIIKILKESLQKVQNTNIVICLPTYKTGSPIYNYKVEMFNNLLYLDNQNYKYAYIFDSNRDLTHDMFSYTTGRLNKYGLRKIYESIMSNILIDFNLYCQTNRQPNGRNTQKEYTELTNSTISTSQKDNSTFFRIQ